MAETDTTLIESDLDDTTEPPRSKVDSIKTLTTEVLKAGLKSQWRCGRKIGYIIETHDDLTFINDKIREVIKDGISQRNKALKRALYDNTKLKQVINTLTAKLSKDQKEEFQEAIEHTEEDTQDPELIYPNTKPSSVKYKTRINISCRDDFNSQVRNYVYCQRTQYIDLFDTIGQTLCDTLMLIGSRKEFIICKLEVYDKLSLWVIDHFGFKLEAK